MAALAALLPLATCTAMAQGANGRLVGTVQDPSGGRIPGVMVTALNLDTTTKETTRSDAAGEYQFASLPSGPYLMEVDVRGFKHWRGELTLVAGASARRDALLEVGGIVEAVTVTGRPGGAQRGNVPAPEVARVRVGGNVQVARLIRQPRAIYPEDLKEQGVQGVVKIAAILSKTGSLNNLQVTSGDPRLARAALDAVAQWRYEPTLLNGEPVEVVTQIEVTFDPGR
jgi:TonB family protein